MKYAISPIAFALFFANGAAYAEEPAKPVDAPPVTPSIQVGGFYQDNSPLSDSIIRPASYDWRGFADIPKSEYPGDAVANKRTAAAKLKVGIGGDDMIIYCTPVTVEKDEALGAGACNLVRKYGKFTHAVDADGHAVTSEIALMVTWDIAPQFSPPPAPPPPPRWLEDDKGGRRWSDPFAHLPNVSLTQEPVWKGFAVSDKAAPRKARTLAKITLGPESQPVRCEIVDSSGNSGIDKASCDALMQGKYQSSIYYYATNPPAIALLVEWNGSKAKVVTPTRGPTYPTMAAPVAFNATQFPADFVMPKWGNGVQISLNSSGKITRCLIRGSTGNDSADATLCALVRKGGRFTAARDVFERPTASGMSLDIDWKGLAIKQPYDNYNR